MAHPRVSIITINFNNLEGLKQTIASVKEQTYQHIEYIVIDGLSDDGSKALLEKESEHFNYWVSEKDKGVFNAMNKGIKRATGDFLLFLNSGDIFTSSDALASYIAHPKCNGDIVYGDYKFKDGGKVYPDTLTPEFFMRSSLPHQSTLIKKSVFETVGFYDESYAIIGDREHFLRAFLNNTFKFSHVPIALALFDLTGLSNKSDFKSQKQQEDKRMFKQHFGMFYEDYLEFFKLKRQLYITEGKTVKGMIRRLIKKIKRLF
ncbi:glycosyltransferase family 2 protein [Winogradskyella sp.]|uniref:glycosyltransferase family 2 protein n=1 Tax=Winogradskyella sp. TaxID=1883156 RepID=UPI00260B2DCF|nr:glycosyltransferase family 2 protein [Winogradskyella sp.]